MKNRRYRDEVKAGLGGYNCRQCEFVAHVTCALVYGETGSESREEEQELGATDNDELMEPVAYIVREFKKGAQIVIAEVKHFSHQHNLIFMDEVKDGLKCDGSADCDCRGEIFLS